MRALIFPLEAPIMALQGASTDGNPQPVEVPGPGMIVGLLGAALGVGLDDIEELEALSQDIEHAVIVRRRGRVEWDFQRARLSDPRNSKAIGLQGEAVLRNPSSSTGAKSSQLQLRPYLSDAAFDIVVVGGDLERFRQALIQPHWPLYLGRTHCIPSRRMSGRIVEGSDLLSIARHEAPDQSVVWISSQHAAPLPGDVPVMIPGRLGGVSLWTRLPIEKEEVA
jgi:CRISPR system Cascade subunit CasD